MVLLPSLISLPSLPSLPWLRRDTRATKDSWGIFAYRKRNRFQAEYKFSRDERDAFWADLQTLYPELNPRGRSALVLDTILSGHYAHKDYGELVKEIKSFWNKFLRAYASQDPTWSHAEPLLFAPGGIAEIQGRIAAAARMKRLYQR